MSDDSDQILGKGALHMRDSDIWSHSHRMYLIGENSPNFPWYMPKDFPNNILNEDNMEKLMGLIKRD